MKKYSIISFDLDGTLLDQAPFDEALYFEELPKIYAEHKKISFEEAKRFVSSEYDRIGDKDLNWYRPSFWFRHFGLSHDVRQILNGLKHRIKLFAETKEVLEELKKDYELIVITNTPNEFLEFKIEVEGIRNYFKHVFSTIEHFNMTKKHDSLYPSILKLMKIKPEEIIHIGDSYESDYVYPKKAGIAALYLDRKREKSGEGIIHHLSEIKKYL